MLDRDLTALLTCRRAGTVGGYDQQNGHHPGRVTAAPAADTLHLTVQPNSYLPRLQVVVNGQDLVDSQHPLGHTGSPLHFESPPCTDVLPPDAVGLLPTTRPTQALVAICGCGGGAGCNSLWITVRRDGHRVVWEPDPTSPRRTIDRTWSFQLLPYLEQIDQAVADNARVEPRGHTIARELRRRQGALFGFAMGTREHVYRLCDVFRDSIHQGPHAGSCLGIEVAGPDGLGWYRVPLPADRSDDDILAELNSFHPERYERSGLSTWVREPLPRASRRHDTTP